MLKVNMPSGISFVLITIALLVVALCGCSSTRPADGGQPPPDEITWPDISAQTGNTVAATAGVTAATTSAQDPTSGAAVTIPAGTRIETSDPAFDTDGDGLADTFAPTLGEISPALTTESVGSNDGGLTTFPIELIGGISLEPADATFSQGVEIAIPISEGSGLSVGDIVTVWHYTDSRTTSQLGGNYWSNIGNTPIISANDIMLAMTVPIAFGSYAVSRAQTSNSAPAISAITSNTYNVETDTAATLSCTATDPDNDTLSYAWSGGGTFASAAAATSSWQSANAGEIVLTCTVNDGHGHSVSASVTVVVTAVIVIPPNLPPVISSVTATPASVVSGDVAALSCTATDPEGDTLSYTWSGAGTFANAASSQTSWNHIAGGTYSLQCTVDDGQGNEVSQSTNVTVTVPDTTIPLWTGGSAGLVVSAFEGYIEVAFNEATDLQSSPVSYTLYYEDTSTFSEGTATQIAFATHPATVTRIDGLALGTDITVGVTTSDSAAVPNSTVIETATAMPQPYYANIPAGDHTFPASTKSFDLSSAGGSDRGVMTVWVDPLSGVLSQSYYTDGAWVVREIDSSKTYRVANVFFNGSLPVVVAGDDAGNLDMLTLGADGAWTSTNLFARAGVTHGGIDVLFDDSSSMAYVAHGTEDAGPPLEQTIHFMVVDMSGATPVIADQFVDIETDQYIGQAMVRPDDSGKPVLVYSHGTASFKFPNSLDMKLVFAAYEAGTGLTADVVTEFNPLFFDVKAAAGGGWDIVVIDGEWFVMGNNDFIYFELRTSVGAGASWTTTDLYTQTLDIVGDVISYDAPLECAWSPTPGSLFFVMGSGDIDLTLLTSAPTLALWSATPPDPIAPEPGNPLTRYTTHSTGSSGFLLGVEVDQFDFEDLGNQHDFPAGILVLRDVP